MSCPEWHGTYGHVSRHANTQTQFRSGSRTDVLGITLLESIPNLASLNGLTFLSVKSVWQQCQSWVIRRSMNCVCSVDQPASQNHSALLKIYIRVASFLMEQLILLRHRRCLPCSWTASFVAGCKETWQQLNCNMMEAPMKKRVRVLT